MSRALPEDEAQQVSVCCGAPEHPDVPYMCGACNEHTGFEPAEERDPAADQDVQGVMQDAQPDATAPAPWRIEWHDVGSSGARNLALTDAHNNVIAWFIGHSDTEREGNAAFAAQAPTLRAKISTADVAYHEMAETAGTLRGERDALRESLSEVLAVAEHELGGCDESGPSERHDAVHLSWDYIHKARAALGEAT